MMKIVPTKINNVTAFILVKCGIEHSHSHRFTSQYGKVYTNTFTKYIQNNLEDYLLCRHKRYRNMLIEVILLSHNDIYVQFISQLSWTVLCEGLYLRQRVISLP